MLQTTNYSLNKPEATDVVDISKLNDNFDTIDTQLKSVSDKANYIQTAGGTATAITLSNVTLSNGFTVTFVAAYSNSGAATAINGKALYKAGTTAAPALIAGKAYTVWYNGTNFFIKASAEGTATAGDVLAGKTFSSDTDTGLSGTMTDNGAVSQSLGINGTYTIPAGYHNGSGKVTQSVTTKTAATYSPSTSAQTISAGQYLSGDQTIAATTGTAAAAEVLSGKTFNSANGIGLAGTMTNNGAVSQSLGINGTYTIPAGYHNGSGKVTQSVTTKTAATYTPGTTDQTIAAGQYLSGTQTIAGDADLVSGNIKSGVNIFGVAGSSAVVDTTEATNPIAAASVLSGKIGYVNGSKVTGTIASKTAATYNPSTAAQTIAAGQYLSGAQTIAATTGTAAASDVLSGKTFNSANGIGLTGTIASKAAATYTPGTADQTITAGQYLSGAQTIKGDANLVAGNIAVGKSIFGVTGTMDPRTLNFPLSIQTTQPTALKSGHIWVNSSDGASYTSLIIDEAMTASMPNGTLLFQVSSLDNYYYSFSNDQIDTSGVSRSISMTNTNGASEWTVISGTGRTFTLPKPLVYSKLGGVVYIEEAYMWDGSAWVLLCNKDKYFVYLNRDNNTCPVRVYNYTNTPSITKHSDIFTTTVTATGVTRMSKNGNYIFTRYETYNTSIQYSTPIYFYKRTGDTFTSFGSSVFVSYPDYTDYWISDDGQYFGVAYYNPTAPKVNGYAYIEVTLRIYQNNGTGWTLVNTITQNHKYNIGYDAYGYYPINLTSNSDGSAWLVGLNYRIAYTTPSYGSAIFTAFKNSDGSFSWGTTVDSNPMQTGTLKFWNNQIYGYVFLNTQASSSYNYYIFKGTVDYTNKTLNGSTPIETNSTSTYILGTTSAGVLYYLKGVTSLYCYNFLTSTTLGYISIPSNILTTLGAGAGIINSEGSVMFFDTGQYSIRVVKPTINESGLITALTLVTNIPSSDIGIYSLYFNICP